MVITLLKFINQMIFNADEEEKKQAKFIAKLETLGIYDLLQKWGQSDNEDILGQITAFQLCANKVTNNIEYQLEVYKNKNKELEVHARVLEKKVEGYKEQQAMFKVMMSDLETYKQKADMTKELATYFSPFSPIQQFSQETLFKQPQTKDKIIDVNLGMKSKDAELIKKLEKENQNLKDVKSTNEKLKDDVAKYKERY